MRNRLRFAPTMLLALGLLSCSDLGQNTAPHARRSMLAIAPRFSEGTHQAVAALAQAGLTFDHVRVIVVRPATDTLADSTLAYSPSDTTLTLVLAILAVPTDSLIVVMQYTTGTTVLFEGRASTRALPLSAPANASNTVSVAVSYTGPGATAKTISILPGSGTIVSGTTTQFVAKALDANNAELLNVPITWSVSDTSIAAIGATTGLLTPKVARGSVVVNADLPNVHGSAIVNLVPQASGLRVVQGAAQTGSPGSPLPLPLIVELVATDGLPGLGGASTVSFTPNGAGAAAPASATFDANGRAQTILTLGSNAGGIYLYTVTAGTFSITVPEIAVVGPPTQLIPSGSTTINLTAGIVPDPVPTFRVADALGNSVPNVPLLATISTTAGSTSFQFLADTIGLGDLTKLAPTKAGTYTVTISSASAATPFPSLTYTITVSPGAAAKLTFDSQPTDVVAGAAMSPAVTVFIQDSFGNTVTTSTASVSVTLILPAGSTATMSGTTSVNAVNGVATFSTLKFSPTGQIGLKLSATSSGLTSALSGTFAIK